MDSGISLPYHSTGSSNDKSILVLLHGLNAHSGTWSKNIPILSRGRRVAAPTLPLWRKSAPLDIANYVSYVDEFLAKFGAKEISIVGNSMGGWIGMRLVELRPKLVKNLILEDSAGGSDPFDDNAVDSVDTSNIPVLIVWGKNDSRISVDVANFLHSKIRNSNLTIFENTGHVPHWDKPDEFNNLVEGFLNK